MTQPMEVMAGKGVTGRNSYLDLLRLVALIGVIIYQWFGWVWTPLAIPFAALTFTVAGVLMAASLDRSVASPWTVLAKRVRRVLPPVWGLAAVAIPLMVWYGSAAGAGPGIGTAPGWRSMLLWLVPLFEPPSSAWGTAWTGSLWFVPAYLWLTLVSPPLLWCFRRWPLRTAALPALGLALALSGTWSASSRVGEISLTFALFAGYWLIGFAYHDNRIQAMSWTSVIILSLILMSAGLIGTLRAGGATAAQLAGLPVANSLWGAGVVILLLRRHGNPESGRRSAWVRAALAGVQGRALTIFLWSFPAFSISAALLARYGSSTSSNAEAVTQQILMALGLIVVAVLLLGWLEDLAIGRSPRLNPFATRPDRPKEPQRRRSALLAWPAMVAGAAVAILVTALVFPADSAPLISRARTAVPAGPQTDSGSEADDSRLPRRVVAGYWQVWGGPSVRLRDVPPAYNVILAAFAIGDATGKATFSQTVQSKASFIADVDALNTAQRPVLLSVGGWDDGGLKITTDGQRRAFVNSVSKIIDTYHFRGIDWDLEHGIDPVQIAQATRDLKSRYGRDFIVTMTPLLEPEREVQQLELAARIADVLDLASPQFYNYGTVEPTWIVDRTLAWGRVVGEDKVAMGFMTVNTPTDTGELTPSGVCQIWRQLVAQAPTARGVSTWSINLDKGSGYDFARECAPSIVRD
jgi:chitinase/peptidoglycan/LPS O-acetylase OafA/YrhL